MLSVQHEKIPTCFRSAVGEDVYTGAAAEAHAK